MGVIRLRSITAAFAIVGVGLTTAGLASAHDDACELRLRDAPIETAELPAGWDWDFFTLERHGAPSLEASIDAGGYAVTLELSCVSDPEGLFTRLEELRQVADNDKIGVVEIGDEALAAREFLEFPTIRWRHDDMVGQLRAGREVDYGDLEVFAERVDELLPSASE